MTVEALGWFALGAGLALLFDVGLFSVVRYFRNRKMRKFDAYIERLKSEVPPELLADSKKEVSELTFRDKSGVLNTVKIVIDPNLQDIITQNPPNIEEMVQMGQAGTLEELMSGHSVSEEAGKRVQEFVFTPNAVKNMRAAGIEPDEVVTKMLKASGRMA